MLLKRAQEVSYHEEIDCLLAGKPVSRSSHIVSLDPMISQELLVVSGRLKHAPLSYAVCHPVILPPRHELSRLILREAHSRAHLGSEWVRRNWIPGARSLLRGIRIRCVTCQRLYGKPRFQKMADLPRERCTMFSTCGSGSIRPILWGAGSILCQALRLRLYMFLY